MQRPSAGSLPNAGTPVVAGCGPADAANDCTAENVMMAATATASACGASRRARIGIDSFRGSVTRIFVRRQRLEPALEPCMPIAHIDDGAASSELESDPRRIAGVLDHDVDSIHARERRRPAVD